MADNNLPVSGAPDDVFALFARFDLDTSQYRVFQRESVALPAPVAVAEIEPEEIAFEIDLEPLAAVQPITVAEPLKETTSFLGTVSTVKYATPMPSAPVQTRSATTRTSLANLQRSLKAQDVIAPAKHIGMTTPVCLMGVAGGVGVTTVTATLARQLSRDGGRCGLYDSARDSLLPLYFGNQQIATHHHRFAGLHSVLGPSIKFLNAATCASTEVAEIVKQHEREFDHILFDSSREDRGGAGCLRVLVAVPDVASAMGVQRWLGRFEGRKPAHETICVLNRFDSGLALHQELRCWYENHFEEVITVDCSPLVPEALAEGVTVLDWAPESDAAADFVRLGNVVRRARENGAAMENLKTQPEGLALCS